MKTVNVEVSQAVYVRLEAAAGELSAIVQVFPVHVSEAGTSRRRYFVVNAHYPALCGAERESVAANLAQEDGEGTCCFIIQDCEGRATVMTDGGGAEALADEMAAGVAVVKASCGWDESRPIIITVDGIEVATTTRFDGNGWVAQC